MGSPCLPTDQLVKTKPYQFSSVQLRRSVRALMVSRHVSKCELYFALLFCSWSLPANQKIRANQ